MRAIGCLPLVALVASCADGSLTSPHGECDTAALRQLSVQLRELSPRDGAQLVWTPFKTACSDALPDIYASAFDPEANPGQIEPDQQSGAGTPAVEKRFVQLNKLACPDGFESAGQALADTPSAQRAVAAYRHCDFGRFKVLSAEELGGSSSPSWPVWGAHALMLEQGLERKEARPITRALYALESRNTALAELGELKHVPRGEGSAVANGTLITVKPDALVFSERELASIEDGRFGNENDVRNHLVATLYEALADETDKERAIAETQGRKWEGRAILAAHPQTRFSTLVDIMYTAGRAEFQRYGLILEPASGFRFEMQPIEPPRFTPPEDGALLEVAQDATGPKVPRELRVKRAARKRASLGPANANAIEIGRGLTVELTERGFSVQLSSSVPLAVKATKGRELATLTEHARSAHAEVADAHTLVISASPGTTLQRLVEAMGAVRGPDCTPEGRDCWFDQVIVTASPAHQHFVTMSRALSAELRWGGLTSDEVGTSWGVGGLALVGPNGTQGEGGIGLDNTGLLPKRAGSKEKTQAPAVRQGKASVKGPLDVDIIRRIVRSHINEVRACYERALSTNPNDEGRVDIHFVIEETGKVGGSDLERSTISDRSVGTCIASAIQTWRFPKPRGARVDVTYPFVLSPG